MVEKIEAIDIHEGDLVLFLQVSPSAHSAPTNMWNVGKVMQVLVGLALVEDIVTQQTNAKYIHQLKLLKKKEHICESICSS